MEYREILWRGKPRQGLQFIAGDIVYIPFLFLFGLILTFLAMVINDDIVSLVLIGIFLSVLYFRYIDNMLSRKATSYTITDKEVIIQTRSKQHRLAYNAITNVYFEEN